MMNYKFINKNSQTTLILLHGTGGSLNDLISIASTIDENANILSLEGHLLEGDKKRYFKRFPNGDFDEISLSDETDHIIAFINELLHKYNLSPANLVGIGYSNGANIIGSIMYKMPDYFKIAILFCAMLPYKELKPVSEIKTKIYLSIGRNDQIIPNNRAFEFYELLKVYKADVFADITDQDHAYSRYNVMNAKSFYNKNK